MFRLRRDFSWISLFIIASPLAAQTLQPESQQEFRRVYGTSGQRPASAEQSSNNTLQQSATAKEYQRVFGQSTLAGSVAMQRLTTPESINSSSLCSITTSTDPLKYLFMWHLVSLDLTAIDHRASPLASPNTYHEQFGPARTARALALIHQAMFEAANAFDHRYKSTLQGPAQFPTAGASRDAAIVEAAYQIMSWLYPGLNDQTLQSVKFNLPTYHTCSLSSISPASQRDTGIVVGRQIAGRIIDSRAHDGSERQDPVWNKDFVPRQAPGTSTYSFTQWQADPVSQLQTALGGYWGQVKPFVLSSGFQFRPAEDALSKITAGSLGNDPAKLTTLPSYNAVRKLGGEARLSSSGEAPSATPADDSLFLAQFWAYDGTANVCAPARFYNQIATAALAAISNSNDAGYGISVKSVVDVARYYALVNIALADAAVAAWDAKYHFQFPRPVTYIRSVDAMEAKPIPTNWFPVGAQLTNSDQPYNITPPFPSYPSGHAVFGGALFGILRQYLKPTTTFTFLSDEFNGRNKDAYNYVRCSDQDKFTPNGGSGKRNFCAARAFTIDCAERENADSRVFMGVHWVFDADDGISMGNKIAREVYRNALLPLDAKGRPMVPPAQVFSVDDPNGKKQRADLLCKGVELPAGWDNKDPTIGFGPLSISYVSATGS